MDASSIRVLHLFSNSKWTGPAEPVVNLCRALHEHGVRVDFACAPRAGSGFNKVRATASEYGLRPLEFMSLTKHRHPLLNWLDGRALRRHLDTAVYDMIHCHMDNDTEIALRATVGSRVPVVRSSYEGTGFPVTRRHRGFVQGCRAIIEPSQAALHADRKHFPGKPEQFFVVDTAIDTNRFDPGRALPDMRVKLGLPREAFLLGIVARIQAHRHYEDLFTAFAAFAASIPEAILVVVGRGTRQDKLAFQPVSELGLKERVRFTGYLDQDEYVGMLAALDAGVFLTPGTDGTCRAVREIMAMGKPMITSDRGMLAEIVCHERHGLVTDGSPDSLLAAMRLLREDLERRLAYGRAARETARSLYSLDHYARSILEIYGNILGAGKA